MLFVCDLWDKGRKIVEMGSTLLLSAVTREKGK